MVRNIYFFTLFVLSFLSCLGNIAFAQVEDDPPKKVLSSEEVKALVSGKTAEGLSELRHFTFKRYYDANGTVRGDNTLRGKREGRWHIDDEGKLCLQYYGSREHCRLVGVDYRGTYHLYRERDILGSYVIVLTFKKFTDGNIYNF